MWYDGFQQSKKRNQTSYVIPAWRKGDKVLHRLTGFYGELVEMQTAGGELWKMKVLGTPNGSPEDPGRRLCVQVHASDLELRT